MKTNIQMQVYFLIFGKTKPREKISIHFHFFIS